MADLLNTEENKKEETLLESSNVNFVEKINKQITDDDLKISQNLVSDKDENITVSEDVKQTSVIPAGNTLNEQIEKKIATDISYDSYREVLESIGTSEKEIQDFVNNLPEQENKQKDEKLKEVYESIGTSQNEIASILTSQYKTSKNILYENPEITQPINDYLSNQLDDFSELGCRK
tara:strand:- start:672 stop:1202 length:531 start_codon:yes stop_codon:yes gene_type:complete